MLCITSPPPPSLLPSIQDIVKDALLTGRLPLAQTFMIRYRGGAVRELHTASTPAAKAHKLRTSTEWSQLTLEEAIDSPDGSVNGPLAGPSSASFESFKATGLGLAVECLELGDVREAVQIATSLVSFNVVYCIHFNIHGVKLGSVTICESFTLQKLTQGFISPA